MIDPSSPGPSDTPDDPPVMDSGAIARVLPHRPPFLLVDACVSVKHVTVNEWFFGAAAQGRR